MDIIYGLLDAFASVIEVIMCFVFVSTFVGGNVIKEYFIGITITAVIDAIFNYITVQIAVYSIFKALVFIGIILLAQFFIYRKCYDRIAVMTVTYMLFLTLIDYSVVAAMTYFSGEDFVYFQEMTLFRVYGTLISKGFLLISVIYIRKKFESLKSLKQSHLFFIFGSSGAVLLFAFYMFQNFMERNQILESEIAIFLLLLLIEILLFYSFAKMMENNEKEEKLALINLHNKMLQESLEEEKHSFDLWSGRIHDYKNHLIYMLELLEAKDYENLQRIMQEETGILKYQSGYVQSGYKGIDAIINSKILYAQSKDIHVFCNIIIPAELSLNERAMITILGNLLDNAIRAEMHSKEKLIEIYMSYVHENIYIKIVNHKGHGEIDFGISDKENSKWHGIGLRSVKQQIKKMNGDFKLMQENEKVIAMVVIYEVEKSIG